MLTKITSDRGAKATGKVQLSGDKYCTYGTICTPYGTVRPAMFSPKLYQYCSLSEELSAL
jgi:hypothetical protein